MKDLQGRTAIITGASRGLGLVVARHLAREGTNVVLAARTTESLEQLATELRGLGVKALVVRTDVTDQADLKSLVEATLKEFKSIDILVNNAGLELFRPYQSIDPSDIENLIRVNLVSTLLLTRFVLPHMLDAGQGHIVNMASTAGKFGPAFGAVYGATKAAMIAFTQSLRGELHGSGVSASAICPGFADDGGVYERVKQRAGKPIPWYVGSTNAEAVAKAVVKSIKGDRPDLIVNFPGLRPVFTINQAFPRIGEWIVRMTTRKFLKRAATRE